MDCPRNECKMQVYLVLRVIDTDNYYGDTVEIVCKSEKSAKTELGLLVDENPWSEYFIREVEVKL